MGCVQETPLRFRFWLDRCREVHGLDCGLYDDKPPSEKGVIKGFLRKEMRRRVVNSVGWFNFGYKCVVNSTLMVDMYYHRDIAHYSSTQ